MSKIKSLIGAAPFAVLAVPLPGRLALAGAH